MAKDGPYGSFEEMLKSMGAQIIETHDGAGGDPPGALDALRATQARYAAPIPFKAGDVVTPRDLMPMKGRGDLHIVLEVGDPPGWRLRDSDASSSGYGTKIDMRVLCFMRGHLAAFWVESWMFEPMAVPADDLPPEAQGPDEAAAKANG